MIHEPEMLASSHTDSPLKRTPYSHINTAEETRANLLLPSRITRTASKQAYYTIRLLVDRDRTLAAYRAYAYFRWVDDWLDKPGAEQSERLNFLARQQSLVECAYSRRPCSDLTHEEQMVVDLVRDDEEPCSGLRSYITHMMAVMEFDARRRGRWVTAQELEQYTLNLAIAVTDALHYFIGDGDSVTLPTSESRYLSAKGAHITHMLRDTFEDVALGYFNVPWELLEANGIDPRDVQSEPYRKWVKRRVQLARSCFAQGSTYLDQVKSARCRLAGYAYMARFVGVLDTIEQEGYRIRPTYPEFARPGYALRVAGSVAYHTLLRGRR